ncbi:MAG: SUMF1/EgtB/PvdO family nonheme iron enzyme, partial [Candidatus Poribacteria bacterium]
MQIRKLQNSKNPICQKTFFLLTLLYILLFCLAMFTSSVEGIPSFSNVKVAQDSDTKLVNIAYDVEDVDVGPLEIKIYISEDGGKTFGVHAKTVTGDVGRGIPQGKGKSIIWNAKQDIGTVYSTNYRVKITAKNPQAKLPETIIAKDGAKMVLVPTGTFLMGSSEEVGDPDEHPQHTVSLDAYYIDQFEVTNAKYAKFMNDTGHPPPKMWGQPYFNKPNLPVVGITWFDAQAYCKWAEKRLPTEAEWEKAARGTDGRIFPWGNDSDQKKANVEMSVGHLTDVGSYPAGASSYGVYDMAGNVAEWVTDWYDTNYYLESPNENPPGPEMGQYRILRGGSWLDTWWSACSANRGETIVTPKTWRIDVGFRCVMDAGVASALSHTFSLDTREEAIATLVGHNDEVDSLAFNPEGSLLVSGGNWDENGIRLWDVKTWKTIRTFPNPQPVYSVKFSPDGMKIASASFDHTVKLWDVITGNLIWTYTDNQLNHQINGVDFSPDGRFIAVAGWDNTARLLDTSNGKEVKRFSMPTRPVHSVKFHPNGRLLSTVSDGGNIVVWDIITGEQIKTFGPGTTSITDF